MAMTLRLSEEQTNALRERADSEGCSMQAIAKRAIEQYLNNRDERLAAAISRVADNDEELLDRLSR